LKPRNSSFCSAIQSTSKNPSRASARPHSAVANVIAGTAGPDEFYYRTAPIFESGDARYAWLNTTVSVAVANLSSSGVSYDVFGVL
jgi:hypothetical protein